MFWDLANGKSLTAADASVAHLPNAPRRNTDRSSSPPARSARRRTLGELRADDLPVTLVPPPLPAMRHSRLRPPRAHVVRADTVRDPSVLAVRARTALSAVFELRHRIVSGATVREVLGRRFYVGALTVERAEIYRQSLSEALTLLEEAIAAGAVQVQLPWVFGQLLALGGDELPHWVEPEAFHPSGQALEPDAQLARMHRLSEAVAMAPEGEVRGDVVETTADLASLIRSANAEFARLADERREGTHLMPAHNGLRSVAFYRGEVLPITAEAYRLRLERAIDAAERALAAGTHPERLADVKTFAQSLQTWALPHRIARARYDDAVQDLESPEIMARIDALASRL